MYTRPSNLSFSDMCIYIDDCVKRGDFSEEDTIYKYMVMLVNMLSRKSKYFRTNDDYEDFSFWVSTYYFLRLKSDKLPKIKSILNYIKNSIYGLKCKYQQEFYSQVIVPDASDTMLNLDITNYSKRLYDNLMGFHSVEVEQSIKQLPQTIRDYLDKKPSFELMGNSKENLYISVLLTFLDSITLTAKMREKASSIGTATDFKRSVVQGIFEDQHKVILYRLDDSMEDYVKVLIKQIKSDIISDLSYVGDYFTNDSDEVITYIDINQLRNDNDEY